MATTKFNFTEKTLDAWAQEILSRWQSDPSTIPADGETWAQDRGGPNSIPALHLRVRLRKEDGSFSLKEPSVRFYLLKKVSGRKFTRELGDRRITTAQSARDEASTLLKSLVKGEDPKEKARREKEAQELRTLTLKKALENLLADSPALTESTCDQYRKALRTTFKDVAEKPLTYFTEAKVREIHRLRSAESPSKADHDMRVLRLVWNWAHETLQTAEGEKVLGKNPVSSALNKGNRRAGKKGWNNVPRKETIIPRAKLPEWIRALQAIRGSEKIPRVRRDSTLFLEVLLLTGLRFTELSTLTWGWVDFARGVLTIPDSSSKNRRELVRPLTRRVREILEDLRPEDAKPEAYVFLGRKRKDPEPLDNTRKLQEELQKRTGLWITPHDLRRVYASAATRAGIPAVALKRLLNHQTNAEEVTEGYVRLGLDELLDLSQEVEDQILRDAGLLDSGLDAKLQEVLQGLPDDAKRKLLFQLAQDKAQGVA